MGALERFGATFGGHGPSPSLGAVVDRGEVGRAELEALKSVDIVSAEDLDLSALGESWTSDRVGHADDLRLPPPPFRSHDGEAVFQKLGKAVDTFTKKSHLPVAASSDALTAETKMMTVLRGIHALEVEIYARRDRHRPV